MAFLFQDQNQGIRIDAPREMRRVATVLFHPDFNRRPRNRTESADPFFQSNPITGCLGKKALAGLGLSTLTAGGEFHPALRTRPPGMSGPWGIMANREGASKASAMGNRHVPMSKSLVGSFLAANRIPLGRKMLLQNPKKDSKPEN
jgi:hypothetical protein